MPGSPFGSIDCMRIFRIVKELPCGSSRLSRMVLTTPNIKSDLQQTEDDMLLTMSSCDGVLFIRIHHVVLV